MAHVDEKQVPGSRQIATRDPGSGALGVPRHRPGLLPGERPDGRLFLVGIAVSSPIMAVGAARRAAIGTAVALGLEVRRGRDSPPGSTASTPRWSGSPRCSSSGPGAMSSSLLVVGCVAATFVTTSADARYLPFPTYTTRSSSRPGRCSSWGRPWASPGSSREGRWSVSGSSAPCPWRQPGDVPGQHLDGAVLPRRHRRQRLASTRCWSWLGSVVGMLLGTITSRRPRRAALDPESLVDRGLTENVGLGLYGYNATLAAVALFLSRRSLISPLLGMLLSVPLTDLSPCSGCPP